MSSLQNSISCNYECTPRCQLQYKPTTKTKTWIFPPSDRCGMSWPQRPMSRPVSLSVSMALDQLIYKQVMINYSPLLRGLFIQEYDQRFRQVFLNCIPFTHGLFENASPVTCHQLLALRVSTAINCMHMLIILHTALKICVKYTNVYAKGPSV